MNTADLSQQLKSLEAAFWRAWDAPVLLVAPEPFAVRGLIVSRVGRLRWRIERYAEVELDTSVRRTRARLMRLFEKLPAEEARRVLVVSDEVSLMQVELPAVPPRRGRRTRAVAPGELVGEIAPFLDYPPEEAMLGFCELATAPREDEDDEAPGRAVWVAALRRSAYEALETLCRANGKRLIGVLPQECFAFAAGESLGQAGIVLELRLHEVLGAFVCHGLPLALERENVAAGETQLEAAGRLVSNLVPPGSELEEVVVGGDSLVNAQQAEELAARPWSLAGNLPQVEAPGPLPAAYMQLMGAAACQQQVPGLLITNRVALLKRLRHSVHTVPLMVVGLVLLGLGGDYAILKQRLARLERGTAAYAEQVAVLRQRQGDERALEERYQQLRSRKADCEQRSRLLTELIPQRDARLLGLLDGLIRFTPAVVQIQRVYQFSDMIYFVEGRAGNAAAISRLSSGLKQLPGVSECRLESSQRQASKGSDADANVFSLRLKLEDEHV